MLIAAHWTKLYRFPSGRVAFALQMTAERARGLPQPAERIARLASRGAKLARETLHLEGAFRSLTAGQGKFPPGTPLLDRRVDEAMLAVDSYLVGQATLFAGTARGDAASHLRDALYPEGTAQIINLPYPAEHARVTTILQRALSPEFADDVAALPDLAVLLTELQARNDAYGTALKLGAERPTSREVRAAQDRCQEVLTATLCLIIGEYELDGEDRLEERDHLLEPIVAQNEAIRIRRRRRGQPTDADPDTGVELGDGLDDELDTSVTEDRDDELDSAPGSVPDDDEQAVDDPASAA